MNVYAQVMLGIFPPTFFVKENSNSKVKKEGWLALVQAILYFKMCLFNLHYASQPLCFLTVVVTPPALHIACIKNYDILLSTCITTYT